MSENHIIVCVSDAEVSPKRVLSMEETVKGGICRSCKQILNVGEIRIKVSYPNVIVQYAARTGSPSFYLHPSCFVTQPVDFWRIGPAAYKDTLPVQGFAVNPEVDMIGYDRFPELQRCFDKSRILYLEQQEAIRSSAKAGILCPGALSIESNKSASALPARSSDSKQGGITELPATICN